MSFTLLWQGVGSGFAEDDAYNVYDNPWKKTSASAVYRPSKNLDKDIYGDDLDSLVKTKRFVLLLSRHANSCVHILIP